MTSSFLKQFNSLFYKFNYVDRKVLTFLFRTYTSSFYGLENWTLTGCKRDFQKLSITYHKAVKRICSMNVWESNHDACKIAEVHIFKHLYAKRRAAFMYSLLKSNSPCVLPLRNYFQLKSFAVESFREYFLQEYQLSDVFSNPLCAVYSRINFVEKNERSSGVL